MPPPPQERERRSAQNYPVRIICGLVQDQRPRRFGFTINFRHVADRFACASLCFPVTRAFAAQRDYPHRTVPTKRGLGDATWNIHPQKVVEQIQAAAYEVLSKPLPEPRLLADHYTMTVCYKEFQKAMAASWFPGVKNRRLYRYLRRGSSDRAVKMPATLSARAERIYVF